MKCIAVLLLVAILVGGCVIISSDVKCPDASDPAAARISAADTPRPALTGETDITVSTGALPPNVAE